MNFPKPLLPSQDRYESKYRQEWGPTEIYDARNGISRFAKVFIWVCVLTGFALIGAAFAYYS